MKALQKTTLTLLFFISGIAACHATLSKPSGPTSTGKGSTQTYTFDTGTLYTGGYFQATNATTVTNLSASGTTYSASITWSSSGTSGTVAFYDNNGNIVGTSLSVTLITCSGILSPISIVNGSRCNSGTVTLSATAPATGYSIRWYDVGSNVVRVTGPVSGTSSYTTTNISSTTNYNATALVVSTGCESPRVTVTATVIAPTVSFTNKSTCSGTATGVTLTNNYASTLNTWTVSSSGVTGASNSSGTSGSSSPYTYILNNTLATTGSSSGTATYTITPSYSGCSGTASALTITVMPVPTVNITASTPNICTGMTGNIQVSNPNNVSGTVFNWTVVTQNATVPASQGTGSTISGVMTNNDGVNPATAAYTITPLAGTCNGSPVTATVNINPLPAQPVAAGDEFITANDDMAYFDVIVPDGMQAQWYANNTISTPFNTSPGFLSSTPGIQTYFVTLKNTITGCESTPRVSMTEGVTTMTQPPSITKEIIRVTGVTNETQIDNLTVPSKSTTNTFLDGLGRTSQIVAKFATHNGNSLVKPFEYDSRGRTSKDYLPYSETNNVGFYADYRSDTHTFYSAANDKVADDYYPFALSYYEKSPLGRPLVIGGVGQEWQPGVHAKNVSYSYNNGSTNDEAEEVRKFASDLVSFNTFYGSNTLTRTSVKDENGHTEIVFKDGIGRVVARKQQLGNTINGTMVNYLQTYYTYDSLGHLKYIIPPGGVAAIKANNWVTNATIIDQHFHQFVYDNRGRITQKKTPGQAWAYYVYDKFNRIVLKQDGNLRPLNKWTFVKYDRQGRAVMIGLYKNTTQTTLSAVQAFVSGQYPKGSTSYYESKGSALWSYTNRSFPDNISAMEVYNVIYYDDYGFTFNSGSAPVYDNAHLSGLPLNSGKYPRGKVTGSRKLILGTSNWIVSAVFYDDYDRVIQIQANNHLYINGVDKRSATYDFEGKIAKTKSSHSPDGTNSTVVLQVPSYDDPGRLTQITHTIYDGAGNIKAGPTVVAGYEYNELGQLVTKKLHGGATGISFMQNVDYRYNIKGWLTSINNAQLTSDGNVTNGDTNDYFGMELLYNASEASGLGNTPYYNGNVSAVKWKGIGDANSISANGQRSYKLTYDNTDKLTAATFQRYGVTGWNVEQNTLNETMSYDHNGNILTLARNINQRGLSGVTVTSTPQAIDNLTYTYAAGNQLSKVTDAATMAGGFTDGANQTTEYTYDTHGNLTTDQNKGISGITYNALGKAQQVTFSNGNSVSYTYDAGGNKLTMVANVTVNGTTTTTTTNYANGYVYNAVGTTNTLVFFPSPEGRVIKNSSGNYEYQYAISDHQGNTRVLFTSAPQQVQSVSAGFETANQASEATNFSNYPSGANINSVSTNAHSGTKSLYLNGATNSQVGLAKSYKIYPGDQLQITAYAKYSAPTGTSGNLSGFATALLNAFSLPAPIAGEVGTPSVALNTFGGIEAGGWGDGTTDNTDPKVFTTIVIFDKNYNFLDVAFSQLTSTGSMTANYTVKEAGYAFIYVSNEQQYKTDVYIDDITMSYTPSSIIQQNDYYPFGLLTQNSWTRDNSTNNFLYDGGNELNTTTGIYETMYRGYDAALGRFMQIDPLAYNDAGLTPYHYSRNNPILFSDPTGALEDSDTGETDDQKKDDVRVISGGWSSDGSKYNAIVSIGGQTYGIEVNFDSEGNVQDVTGSNLTQESNGTYSITTIDGCALNGNVMFDASDNGGGLQSSGSGPPSVGFGPGSDLWNSSSNFMTGIGMAVDVALHRLGKTLDKSLAYSPRKAGWGSWMPKSTPVSSTRLLGFDVPIGLVKGTATTLKVAGATLGALGVGMTAVEYFNGKISGAEATLDTVMGVVGFLGPIGAGASILYFGGKFLYEYTSGDTLFEKP